MLSADPMTLPEAQRALQSARAVLAHPTTPSQSKTVKRMWEYFDWFERMVCGTPFAVATPRQSRAMRRALQIKLPKVVRACAVLLAQNYPGPARKKLVAQLPDKVFRGVYWHQFGKQLDSLAQTGAPTSLPPSPSQQALTVGEQIPVFPTLTAVNTTVDTALQELRADWTRAVALPALTTEDRFLLHQIAKVYLPDSWRLYGEAQRLHADVREQAAGMLLTQLTTLQHEVTLLLTQGGQDVLTRLGVQTRFIQQKSTPVQPPTLELKNDTNQQERS